MTIWHLHLLNARNALTGVMPQIRATARAAVALAAGHVDLPRFDLIVRAAEQPLPDSGMVGRVTGPGVIEVTLTPGRFQPDALRRLLLREMVHLLRGDRPGGIPSLGEAVVSEGLAAQFAQVVLGGEADPRDAMRPAQGSLRQAANLWARRDYDHDEWFSGRGRRRRGTGQGIGHRLIAEHLAHAPGEDVLTLLLATADSFRPALRRLLATEGIEAPEEDGADESAAGDEPADTVPGAEVSGEDTLPQGRTGEEPSVRDGVGEDRPVASGEAGGPAPSPADPRTSGGPAGDPRDI
ncbi:hypothetical protein E4191_00335 [Paracoccus liaowanqingii]|uniref:DUF2268 domain-containing protein n=1 Tax=Paracoccus liaowanqingii TaxID=2560053 RepID=A0A4V1BIG0_9RHOB|nr:DUF2268 domain-containing putative Zn-dependent protease [Paracoccus liaowanqingii]QBX33339.1 hypothetical protein E4191_00335 [Paracoccus liaowanqingii]